MRFSLFRCADMQGGKASKHRRRKEANLFE
jgi:hypothetical protein